MVKEILQKDYDFNVRFLNTLDLSKYIESGKLIGDIVEEIELDYNYNNPNLLPKELAGCIFNFMDLQEVADYLKIKYHIRYYKIEDYKIC